MGFFFGGGGGGWGGLANWVPDGFNCVVNSNVGTFKKWKRKRVHESLLLERIIILLIPSSGAAVNVQYHNS